MADTDKKNKQEPTCKLTMFPACEGDCFLLEFGTGEDVFRMMIDSGTVGFGNKCLKEEFCKLKKEGKKIDVLVITHVDGDHIGGALSVLRLKQKFHNMITEVWYNGLQQIVPNLPEKTDNESKKNIKAINASNTFSGLAEDGGTSAEQSEELTELIANHKIKVNGIAGGKAITTELGGRCIGPLNDIEVFVLLPGKNHLNALQTYLEEALPEGVKLDKTSESEECMTKKLLEDYDHEYSIDACAEDSFDISEIKEWAEYEEKNPDDSPTNASSISLIIRYRGKKYLFAGDARGRDLSKALKRWLKKHPDETLKFDVVKLPHHGSNRNCMELLKMGDQAEPTDPEYFDAKLFLVSADGRRHPHKETLAKAVVRPTEEMRTLAFSYEHAMYRLFKDKKTQEKYKYSVVCNQKFLKFEVREK